MTFGALVERADRAVLAHLADTAAEYRTGSAVSTSATVRGVFDANFELEEIGEPGVASYAPVFFGRLSDFPSDPKRDEDARIRIAAQDYRIKEAQHDSQGGVLLVLFELS
jgi:hypothetical protein